MKVVYLLFLLLEVSIIIDLLIVKADCTLT